MGRGRAKAKQQKVARELKYNNQFTDLDALQRELGGSSPATTDTVDDDEDEDESGWASTGRYAEYLAQISVPSNPRRCRRQVRGTLSPVGGVSAVIAGNRNRA